MGMNQRGFAPLLMYGAIAAGAIILVLGAALWVQNARLEKCKIQYAAFVAGVKALGEEAKKKAAAKEAADKLSKEKADAETQKLRGELAAIAKRLRDARSNRGFLPA